MDAFAAWLDSAAIAAESAEQAADEEQEFQLLVQLLNSSDGSGAPEAFKQPRERQCADDIKVSDKGKRVWQCVKDMQQRLAAEPTQPAQMLAALCCSWHTEASPGSESASICDIIETLHRRNSIKLCRLPVKLQLTNADVIDRLGEMSLFHEQNMFVDKWQHKQAALCAQQLQTQIDASKQQHVPHCAGGSTALW